VRIRNALAVVAVFASSFAAARAASDNDGYVLIATGGGNYYWGDISQTASDFGLASVRVLLVFTTPQQSPGGKAYTVARANYAFNCAKNTYDVVNAGYYDATGKQVDVQKDPITSPDPAQPGSLVYGIEAFGCQNLKVSTLIDAKVKGDAAAIAWRKP